MKKIILTLALIFGVFSVVNARIIYTNGTDGNKLYSTVEIGNNGTAITQNQSSNPDFSPDGQYIVYENNSDNPLCYKKNANDTSNGWAVTNYDVDCQEPMFSPDGQYIIYRNGNNGFIYRKNANDTSNGTAINSTSSYYPTYSPDGQYIIYRTTTDGFLYRKNANDTGNGSAITSVIADEPTYSPDGQYIVYTNQLDNYTLYRKNANDTGNGSAITGLVYAHNPTYSPDGQYIVYTSILNDSKLYRKNANDTGDGSAITSVTSYYAEYEPILPSPICGGNASVYPFSTTSYSSSFCSVGTSSPTSPSFPSGGASIYWTCTSGTETISCSAYRYPEGETPPPETVENIINGECGTRATTYGYTTTAYPSGTYCGYSSIAQSPAFPDAGATVNWTCYGSGSTATNASCSASRQAPASSCATAPSGGNYGALTYNPIQVNQSWTYSSVGGNCTYTCLNGYTGAGCSTAPVSETGATTDTGFWGSIFNPMGNFFSGILDFLKNIFSLVVQSEPYGFSFTGNATPITISATSTTVGCGVTDVTGYNYSMCWVGNWYDGGYYGLCALRPTGSLGNYTGWQGSGMNTSGNWQYDWTGQYYSLGSWRYNTAVTSVGEVNVNNPIVNGQFTFLKDRYGRDISTENIVQVNNTFSMAVNWKYDIKIFGYGLLDLINGTISIFIGGVRLLMNTILDLVSPIIDVVGMFFISYPDNGNACYFGGIYPIKGTMTETGITHTANNGILNVFIIILGAIFGIKFLFSKIK